MTARLAPLTAPFPEAAERVLAEMRMGLPEPLALFRSLAHNPRVLDRVRLGGLLDRGSLTVRQRELIILRTTALCGAEYEWGVHVTGFGDKAGLTDEERTATVTGSRDPFGEDERLLLSLVESLHRQAAVDDALWALLAAAYTPAQLVELVMLVGFYHSISFAVNVFAVPLETWAARFPAP